MSFPLFRALGGALLVVAGLFAYYGVNLGVSSILLIVAGGVVLIAAVAVGHRPRFWDVALFAVALLVLSGVTAGYAPSGGHTATYSASRSQLQTDSVSLVVSSSAGSVDVAFTDRTDVAYQVNFTRPLGVFSIWPSGPDTLTNSTSGGRFNLKATTSGSEVKVLLGRGYSVDLDVNAGSGSIRLTATGNEELHNVTLSAGAGSVSVVIDTSTITNLKLNSGAGSVSLSSSHLGVQGKGVPVTVNSGAGSVSVSVTVPGGEAVSLTAGTGLGTLSHSLTGFTLSEDTETNLVGVAGNPATASNSLTMNVRTGVGSVNVQVTAA